MSDIFISYSSHDRDDAEKLSEQLAAEGLSVWIDHKGIVGAEQWTAEIVEGINACSTFLLLFSPESLASGNVFKELTLASEKNKRILPVELRAAQPLPAVEYLIAGLQRVPVADIAAIVRSHRYGVERIKPKDLRKSLIIMPFEDLSPSQDNLWFANGLAGELIDSLSHIKSLRILDRKTSLDLRGVKQTTVEIGKLFNTHYFVEGSVRKFNEQIKISVSLLDVEAGDYLWQESFKGKMKDIFELQESVAEKVVEGLKLHLTKEEKSLLEERGTENAEAYELFLKALEYSHRQTKESKGFAGLLYDEVIALDPNYLRAYANKAESLTALYRSYDRNPALLDEAERLCDEALKRRPEFLGVYNPLTKIFMHRGRKEDAERALQEWIEREPANFHGHFALGFFYSETGQPAKAIAPYEAALRLKPDYLESLTNVVSVCDAAGEHEKSVAWAGVALPFIENHLRLHPDDEIYRVMGAILLHISGRDNSALAAARELVDEHSPKLVRDSNSLYNTACLFGMLGIQSEAIRVFCQAIKAGYRNPRHLKEFLTDENEGIASLAGTPEYEEVRRMIEEIEREQGKQ